MAATRKSRSQKWTQTSIDPVILPVVVKALGNRHMKKPRCPLPDCEWESYTEANTWRMSAMGRLKRHVRDKHRAYYQMATAKPFIIQEEEDQAWSLTLST
jgi:hypothetical protein